MPDTIRTQSEQDKALRSGTYSEEIWKQVTGKNLEELWAQFVRE